MKFDSSKRHKFLLTLTGLVISFVLAAGHAASKRVTVCQLSAHPKAYEARTIAVRARVIGGFRGMALMDNHCSEKTLYLNISNYFAEKPDIKPLFDVIYKEGTAGSVGKNVEATFVGIFRRPNEQWPVGELRVRHMYELKWRFSPSGE